MSLDFDCKCGPVIRECRRYPGTKHWKPGMCRHGKVWMGGTSDPMDLVDIFEKHDDKPVVRVKPARCRFCERAAAAANSCAHRCSEHCP